MFSNEEILNFIKRFQNNGTVKTFTQGCCYWFAKILDERFNSDDPESGIWYNAIDNHFATLIGINLYDITGNLGNIREIKGWEPWNYYMCKDNLVTKRIFRDCIYF